MKERKIITERQKREWHDGFYLIFKTRQNCLLENFKPD